MQNQATTTNFEKHTSSNPIQKYLIEKYFSSLFRSVKPLAAGSILDAGCGEAITLARMKKQNIGTTHAGIDMSDDALQIARSIHPDITVKKGDIYNLQFQDNMFDMVLCLEVLEHLDDPQRALKELVRVSRKHIALSVPYEPYFQLANFLRGKYLKTLGNHPEHIQHWSAKTFQQFVSRQHVSITECYVSFPWIILLAEKLVT